MARDIFGYLNGEHSSPSRLTVWLADDGTLREAETDLVVSARPEVGDALGRWRLQTEGRNWWLLASPGCSAWLAARAFRGEMVVSATSK